MHHSYVICFHWVWITIDSCDVLFLLDIYDCSIIIYWYISFRCTFFSLQKHPDMFDQEYKSLFSYINSKLI